MKNIQRKKPTAKRIIFIAALIALFALVGAIVAYTTHSWPFISSTPTTQSNQTSPEQRATDNSTKKDLIENNNTYNGAAPAGGDNIELTATQGNKGSVTVLTKLHGYSDGSCTLKTTNGTASTTQIAPIIYQQEYSTCAGFSVNTTNLGSGTWTLLLTVTSKGESTTKQVSVSVE